MIYADGQWWPTTLDDLHPHGTPAVDCEPYDMRGIPWRRWLVLMAAREAGRIREESPAMDPAQTELARKRIWNPRDDYGYRSSAR